MSRTKHMRKSVPCASNAQLMEWEKWLEVMATTERNPMRRSSWRQCLEIVRNEQQRRDISPSKGE